ncbi:GyrI-like domain-containing protein [Bacteroides acidifaciens]|uniref:AraC family transcriptional regulator n=1 Tax=Bacteroides acidifaciens TaxID=85831 RepID=UPI0020CA3C54|nr:GyrI-like domain-containing protein [Bacteroides acidifaciens]
MIQKNWTGKTADEFNHLLSIPELAKIACMSVRNLQLMFKAYTSETLHQYIIRTRMEYAQQLLKDKNMSITEICEYIGFANQSALNNALQKKYNLTPRELQKKLLETTHVYPSPIPLCRIVESETIPILFLSYTGDYNTCSSVAFEAYTWDYLYEYAKENSLLPNKEDYWGIAYDDTDITSSEKCRFYTCMTIQRGTGFSPSLTSQIKYMELPQSTYAVYTHQGDYALLDAFYETILKQLPQSYCLGETPILEHYLNSPTDTEVKELLTEVWIPIVQ